MTKTLFGPRILYYLIPSLVFFCILSIEWIELLAKNHGFFSYTLDDPYIHLSLAKQIMLGHYGINGFEYSSPSSSILWPFLLAPFSFFSWFEYVPLVFNFCCALVVLWIFALVVNQYAQQQQFSVVKLLLLCLLVPALNLPGCVFMGMEHGLQMLLSVLLILGLIIESRSHQFPAWLAAVIILGPLVRYENLALSIPSLILLFYKGHYRHARLTFEILCLFLLSFTLFLTHIDQPLLPASILNKKDFNPSQSTYVRLFAQCHENLGSRQGVIFLIYAAFSLGLIAYIKMARAQKYLIGVIFLALIVHLFGGKFGWFERYEIYLHAAFWLLLVYLIEASDANSANRLNYLIVGIMLVLASVPYFNILYLIPWSANNIYLQQYQLRELVTKNLKEPIAANDIGWLSFNNSNYVLDLWGLGNFSVYQKRTGPVNPQWMDRLTQQYHVRMVMVSPFILRMPANWVFIGYLSSNTERVLIPSTYVVFYATKPEYIAELQAKLMAFKKTLPPEDNIYLVPSLH